MQDRPDLDAMLNAVARFLETEAVPACSDPAVAFRLRIAAHLSAMAAREVRNEANHDAAELDALETLLGFDGSLAPAERRDRIARRQAIRGLERLLCEQISAGDVDQDASYAALRDNLRRKLAVANPRFDLRDDLP